MAPTLRQFCLPAALNEKVEVKKMVLPYTEQTIDALIKTAYEGAEKVDVDVSQEEHLKDLISASSLHKIIDLTQHVAGMMLAACTKSSMLSLFKFSKVRSQSQ